MLKKKTLTLIARIIISGIIIYFLCKSTNILDIAESIIKTNHKVWLLGIVLYIAGQLISAYKWKLLTDAVGFKKKLTEHFDYYFIGMFFNLFLPTTVGGDVTKCYYLSKGDPRNRKAPAVYSVLAERYTGVIIIAWMATIMMFLPIGNPVPLHVKLLMAALSVLIIIITPLFPIFCLRFLKRKKWIITMLRDVRVYWDNPRLMLKTLYWSVLFHLLIVAIHITVGSAMGINIPPAYYLIIYPMTAMAGFIPVAFNGIGPREATYIYFFSLLGVKSSTAIAFSIFWFGIVFCSSLIGGLFYIKGKHVPPPEEFDIIEEMEEEADEELVVKENEKTQAVSV